MRLLLVLLLLAFPAAARTLPVGPAAPYRTLAAAAAAARDGDVVAIAPGDFACATWRANRLTIMGAGIGRTRITGPVCAGKGLFVTAGQDITVRDLTLAGARGPDGNGSGIRAEGANLTVERVRFADNEDGILTRPDPQSTLVVRDSEFFGNGSCAADCAHGIYAGRIARLVVEHSRFSATRQGHHIKSRAQATEVRGCDIEDGALGTASYLIDVPDGGAVLIAHNLLVRGPRAENRTAIAIGEEGASNPTPSIVVTDNVFRAAAGLAARFVWNRTATPARLSGNRLSGAVTPLAGPGTVQ